MLSQRIAIALLAANRFAESAVSLEVKKVPRTQMERREEAPRWARGEESRRRARRPHLLPQALPLSDGQVPRRPDGPQRPGLAQLWEVARRRGRQSAPQASAEALEAVIAFVKSHGRRAGVDKFDSVVSTTVSAKAVEEHLETRCTTTATRDRNAQVIRAVRGVILYRKWLCGNQRSTWRSCGALVPFRRHRLKPCGLVKEVAPKKRPTTTRPGRSAAPPTAAVNPHAMFAERYGFEFPKLSHAKGNSLGLAEFQRQYYDDPDLQAFTKACKLQTNVTVAKVEGGNDPKACSGGFQGCVERSAWISSTPVRVAGAIPLKVYYATSTRPPILGEPVTAERWRAARPQCVVWQRRGAADGSSLHGLRQHCFGSKLSATGVSILFAAGDQGVWGREGVGTRITHDFPAETRRHVRAWAARTRARKEKLSEETRGQMVEVASRQRQL